MNGELEGKPLSIYIENIGSGGAMVFSSYRPVENERLRIQFIRQEREFFLNAHCISHKEISEKRQHILQIAKNMDFVYRLNLKFENKLSKEDMEFIGEMSHG